MVHVQVSLLLLSRQSPIADVMLSVNTNPLHARDATASAPPIVPALRVTRVVVGALSLVLGIASLALMVINLGFGRQTEYLALSLEACGVLAGAFGVLFARGKFAAGTGMTLACIAGTCFTVAILSGWVALRREMALSSGSSINLTMLTYARVGFALIIAILAAFEVLRRSPRSGYYLSRAVAAGLPLGLLGGGMYFGRSHIAAGTLLGPSWLTWTAAGVASIALIALTCFAAHCVIRAFESGRTGE